MPRFQRQALLGFHSNTTAAGLSRRTNSTPFAALEKRRQLGSGDVVYAQLRRALHGCAADNPRTGLSATRSWRKQVFNRSFVVCLAQTSSDGGRCESNTIGDHQACFERPPTFWTIHAFGGLGC